MWNNYDSLIIANELNIIKEIEDEEECEEEVNRMSLRKRSEKNFWLYFCGFWNL